MEPDVSDLIFAVELKLQLSQLSFGQHGGLEIVDPSSDFSELYQPALIRTHEPICVGRWT